MKIRKETTEIVIHHSLSSKEKTTKEDIYKWHVVERGFEDIGYHYMIDGKGEVLEGRNIGLVGAHCRGENHNSIGICMFGSFDIYAPNYVQVKKLMNCITWFTIAYPTIEKVRYHRSTKNPCPGKYFQQMFPDGIVV